MNIDEYNKVKYLKYLEYCNYLQAKYGIPKKPYFSTGWSKNAKISRTSEGLIAHHKYEDHAILLSTPQIAQNNPYEWQLPENIVYCDYLEHLLLHVLICENPSPNKNLFEVVGIGGVINFIVPELNDFYSGWKTNQSWRKNCHDLIKNDKNVYFEILKRFKHNCSNYPFYDKNCLYTSFNEQFGLWSIEKNKTIFKEISKL